jgi:hypothetical protein
MSIAVGQVLEGMPDPAHLHRIDIDDQVVIMVGSRVLFCFAATDIGMRNLAVVTLTGMRFPGLAVAALMGLTPGYISTLNGRARDHGSAGLVREMGRPTKLTGRQIAQAGRRRAEKVSAVVIGARLGSRSPSNSNAPTVPASPKPSLCSSKRSTTPHPTYPATPDPSPTPCRTHDLLRHQRRPNQRRSESAVRAERHGEHTFTRPMSG